MPCFRFTAPGAALWLVFSALCSASHAQSVPSASASAEGARPVLTAEDRVWLERSRQILRDAQGQTPEYLKAPPPASANARTAADVLKASRSTLPAWAQPGGSTQAAPKSGRYLFVSFSMPEAELLAALAEAATHNAVIVVRGIAPGESVASAGAHLKALAERLPSDLPPPEVQLDPMAFRRYAVDAAPTAVIYGGSRELRATGTLALGDLARRFAAGERGALGRRGVTYPIIERDFLEEIQSRLARVDWAAQRQGAYQRYWTNQEFVDLPVAERDAVRRFDPSVEASRDLYGKAGQLVVKAGARLNPQSVMPLRGVWFIFDPLDDRQVRRVVMEARAVSAKGLPLVLMATRLQRGREWDSLRDIEDALGVAVSLANTDFLRRFDVRRLPSRIQGDGDMLQIAELGVRR